MDNLRSILLSKNNVSQLYQSFMTKNRLMNADVARKTQITQQLVATMNGLYGKIDKSRITPQNLPSLVSKFNEAVMKRMGETLNAPQLMQDRIPDRMMFDRVESKKEISPQERLQQLQAARDRDIPDMRKNRPPTPDFSLDGFGRKEKPKQKEEFRVYEQQAPEDFSAFNGLEDEGNLDVYDTGIDFDNYQEDNTPLEVRLQQLQSDRNSTFQAQPEQKPMSTPINRSKPQPRQQQQPRQVQPQQQPRQVQPQQQPRQVQPQEQQLVPLSEVELVLAEQKAYYEGEIQRLSNSKDTSRLKTENEMLLKEIKRLNEEGSDTDNDQIKRLETKKEEIKQELERLNQKHMQMESTLQATSDVELRIEKKKQQLQSLMDKYDTDDFIEVINSRTSKYKAGHYEYNMDTIYEDIVGIHIGSYDIPCFPYNITQNNKLYINDDVYEIRPGDYTIHRLLNEINAQITPIVMSLDEATNCVHVRSPSKFTIKEGDGDMNEVLGITSGDYDSDTSGVQPYYLPREHIIKVYINNEHVSTISLLNNKVYNYNNLQYMDDIMRLCFKTGDNVMINHKINHRLELIVKTRKEVIT
jgi:hypothetical protein